MRRRGVVDLDGRLAQEGRAAVEREDDLKVATGPRDAEMADTLPESPEPQKGDSDPTRK